MKFELNKEQQKKFQDWDKENPTDYTGLIGGGVSFIFNPTTIGVVCKCVKISKGKEIVIDLTDSGEWG